MTESEWIEPVWLDQDLIKGDPRNPHVLTSVRLAQAILAEWSHKQVMDVVFELLDCFYEWKAECGQEPVDPNREHVGLLLYAPPNKEDALPWDCAGWDVYNPCDLFKVLETSKYAPMMELIEKHSLLRLYAVLTLHCAAECEHGYTHAEGYYAPLPCALKAGGSLEAEWAKVIEAGKAHDVLIRDTAVRIYDGLARDSHRHSQHMKELQKKGTEANAKKGDRTITFVTNTAREILQSLDMKPTKKTLVNAIYKKAQKERRKLSGNRINDLLDGRLDNLWNARNVKRRHIS